MVASCARFGAIATLTLLTTVTANVVNVVNRCDHVIEFSHSAAGRVDNATLISVGGWLTLTNVTGPTHMFRHTAAVNATVADLTINSNGAWFDISIIPPNAGYCSSFEECRSATGGSRGFNVALGIAPKTSDTDKFCDVVYCGADDADMCQDAYLYPTDSKKARRCANTTDFDVVFCPESKDALVTLMTTENSEFDLEGTVQVPAEVPGGSTSTVEGSAVSTTTSIDFVTNQDGDAALNGIDFGTGSTASDTNGAVEGFDDTATRTPATTSASLTLTFAESPSAEIDSVDAQVETEGEAALTTKTSLRH